MLLEEAVFTLCVASGYCYPDAKASGPQNPDGTKQSCCVESGR